MIDEIWKTEIILNSRGRYIPYDADLMHRILTLHTQTNTYLWSHPRTGILIIQSDTPLSRDAFKHEAREMRAVRIPLNYYDGQRVEIAGIINPTKSKPRQDRHSTRVRLDLEQVPDWLDRRTNTAFQLDAPISLEQLPPAKGTTTSGHKILCSRVAFHTYATIKNHSETVRLVRTGIGQAKRYGCGMLTIKPAGARQ